MTELSQDALDQIFLKARTRNGWQDKPVPVELLREIYDIARMGPTMANTVPLRIAFVTSPEAKAKLEPALSEGNRAKTMKAPVVALFAHDLKFYDFVPKLMPHNPGAREWFTGDAEKARAVALHGSTLQAAYFMITARAKGLDCGPMGGFDKARVNETFFPDGRWEVNFICSLGYGTDENLFPRNPRLSFEEACRIV